MRDTSEFKFKIAVLGTEESYKTAFRESVANGSLSSRNKEVIGVTIAGLKIDNVQITNTRRANLYISLWDLECSDRFSMFRTSYYRGSEAVIVILDENTLEQAKYYYEEILHYVPSLSLVFVILTETPEPRHILGGLQVLPLHEFEQVQAQYGRDVITWVVDKFRTKLQQNYRKDYFAIIFLPKQSISTGSGCGPQYIEYVNPIENLDELNPQKRLNINSISRLLENFNIPVQYDYAVVQNKFGLFEVSLRDGGVSYIPQLCLDCSSHCLRREYICIIASTKGFSTVSAISQGELLVLTKIFALQSEDLPDHVLQQIDRIFKCPFVDTIKTF